MQTTNEKIAKQIVGKDGESVIIPMSIEENARLRSEQAKYNSQVDNMNEKFEKHIQALKDATEEISKDLNGLEITPIYNYLIIEPLDYNPFQKVVMTQSGIITDLGGMAPEYKSEEDGQYHEEEQMIGVANVIEVGHRCEFVKPGDIIMYPKPLTTPIPFYKLGFHHICENKVICVINEGLTDRKNGKC